MDAALRLLASAINPEVQHAVDQTMKNLKSSFPVAKKAKVVFERRNNATFDPWDWEIKVPMFGKDESLEAVDREEDLANAGTLQYGFIGTIIHEYGHAINAGIIKLLKTDDERDAWFNRKKVLEQHLGHPSHYASKNSSEWFAEQFLFEYKGHGNKLLQLIDSWSDRKFITEYMKDWNGE
jgi:uncharacterized protein (UPF0218 family)